MRPRLHPALAACGALMIGAALASGPAVAEARESRDVHALIARVVEAYGGRKALDAVRAYRAEGDLFAFRRHDESPTVRVFSRPDRLKTLIQYEDGYEARIMDGSRGWRNEPGNPIEPATGPMAGAMLLQAARAGVPWILFEREAEARAIEPLEREGAHLAGIEIPLGEGLAFRAYIDSATGRVAVSQGVLDHGGMSTQFETVYSDFRPVRGVQFAFREENWASGVQTGITTIRRVMLNPRLARDEFVPPRGTPQKSKGKRGAS